MTLSGLKARIGDRNGRKWKRERLSNVHQLPTIIVLNPDTHSPNRCATSSLLITLSMRRGRTLSLGGLSFGSSKHNLSQGPPSPTLSEATNASAINFGANVGPSKIITRANLKASLQAYEDVSRSSSQRPRFNRRACLSLSTAAQHTAQPLSPCRRRRRALRTPWKDVARMCLQISLTLENWGGRTHILRIRLKGPSYEAGSRLQAASGVHHLIGNLWHVLVRITLLRAVSMSYARFSQILWITLSKSLCASICTSTGPL
jgi:hypothetical protein